LFVQGGQLFRNTAALSVLLGKPVIIDNIRAGREKPGLRCAGLLGNKWQFVLGYFCGCQYFEILRVCDFLKTAAFDWLANTEQD
jgi:hypothetical protein